MVNKMDQRIFSLFREMKNAAVIFDSEVEEEEDIFLRRIPKTFVFFVDPKFTVPKNKCDSGLGLHPVGLALDSDFVIEIAHFGIVIQNLVDQTDWE